MLFENDTGYGKSAGCTDLLSVRVRSVSGVAGLNSARLGYGREEWGDWRRWAVRRVLVVATGSPSPRRVVQRARLWAIVWTASQAALLRGTSGQGEGYNRRIPTPLPSHSSTWWRYTCFPPCAKAPKLPIRRMGPAIVWLRHELSDGHPLALDGLRTDSLESFVEQVGKSPAVSEGGQLE